MRIDEIMGWPPQLHDEREIAAYIESVSSAYVDPEQIEEYLGHGATAVLKTVPISALRPGGENNNIRDPKKEKRYAKMNPQTMPPLVAWDDGEIIDGNHRYRIRLSQGATEILCYIVSS